MVELPSILEQRDHGSVLVVTDRGVVEAGLVDAVTNGLSVPVRTFDGVEPNPSRSTVDRLDDAYDGEDVVIAVGGGSVMDAAKAATALGTVRETADGHPLDTLLDWPADEPVPEPAAKVPLVLVPTTAGTGSETGHWAVISDPDRGEKLSVGHRCMAADVAVLDSELTTSLPPYLTASSGFDVIAHALEALVATGRTPLTQPAATAAARAAIETLPRAVETGDDLDARTTMLAASYLAGVAMNNAGLGAVHGISHAIGGLYDTPHGHTNARLLPPVVRRNAARSEAADAAYARLTADADSGRELAERLSTRLADVGLDRDLPGLPSDPDWDRVAERAVGNVNMATNPVEFDVAAVVELCRDTFG